VGILLENTILVLKLLLGIGILWMLFGYSCLSLFIGGDLKIFIQKRKIICFFYTAL
jgi:hypothetical protein